MILSALFAAMLTSEQDYVIPAEASADYRKLATSIEDAMVEKNYEKGAALIAQLPRANATFRVDATKVPAAQRIIFAAAIAESAKMWQSALDGTVTFASSGVGPGDITLLFTSVSTPLLTWTPNAAPAKLTANLPVSSGNAAYDSRVAFARYIGLGTISKGPTLTPKDIEAAKKILNLTRLLNETIQSMAPDFQVPAGASSEFHHLVLDIAKALSTKNYAEADLLGARLPKSKVTWSFDDSKLNADQKEQFSQSAQVAVEGWEKFMAGQVEFKKVPKGKADISFSFEPVLAKVPGTNQVAGTAFFLAGDASLPQIEAVIGLKRGPKLDFVLAREVYNECLFTVGRYFGLAPSPQVGAAMGRLEGQMPNQNNLNQAENGAARKLLSLSTYLRGTIQKRQSIEVRQPIVSLEKLKLDFDPQLEGDLGRATMLVSNPGTSTLVLELKGDCGCITGEVQATILPGKSAILTGKFDTIALAGDVHHNLILKTNDPDKPVIVIPVSITVTPRAEIVFPSTNTAYMDQPERTFVFYVHSAESKLFKVSEANVMGMSLTAKAEPFDGEVTNFQKAGKKQLIHGYKVTVDTSKVPTEALFGRNSITVYLRTDSPKINLVKAQVFVQKGIVSLPETVYLGSPQGVADSTFSLIRTGRPFAIKKITSDSKYLTFEITPHTPTNPSAYNIQVIYDGKAPGHRIKGIITIETDDPKQPTIKLPYQTNQT